MKRIIILMGLLLMVSACTQKRFDRVCKTGTRYDIVYVDEKCGVFDTQADSLVTLCEYDDLAFLRRAEEDSVTVVVLFRCSKEGREGMMGVLELNNETMEILFPAE